MAYGTTANIRALTGLTTTEVDDTVLGTIITMADSQIDSEPEVSLSSAQKILASDYLSSVMALENSSGSLSIDNLIEISGAIKIDTKTAALIRGNLAKRYYEKYKEIISQAPSDELIRRVP